MCSLHLQLTQQLKRFVQVTVIKWAGTAQQQVWQASIGTVGDKIQGAKLSPCIIVVGRVTQYANLPDFV